MAASQSPLNVAIIGAGIGGLAVAIGLLKENIPYTIYEAAAEYSMVGAGVGLGPNALRSMNLIDSRFKDLYDSIATGNSTREKENIIYDVRTVEPGWGENEGWTGFPVGSKNYIRTSAHRKDLLDIMTSMIPIETVRFRKKVASMKQEGGKVVINFEDGEVVEASTVIGCDGVHGASRPAVLGERYPEHVYATYSGKYVYRSIVPMENAIELLGDLAGDGQMFMGNKRNILAYPISQGKDCNVVAFRYEPWPHEQWTHMVSREKMISDFDGCDPRLVKLLDWAKPLQWSLWHHLKTPIYYNGLICILGDSAHASTPHQAGGAGQALEDALILVRLLALITDAGQIETAFKVYDGIRRPRAQEFVRTSNEAGQIYSLSHPECGTDLQKVADNCNQRFTWIWEHDTEGDVNKAVTEFKAAVGA